MTSTCGRSLSRRRGNHETHETRVKKKESNCLFLVCFVCFVVIGCRSRAPYEGKSVAELEAMLRDADPKVQAQGAFGLSRLGAEARPAVKALAEALKNRDARVRQNAALALAEIGPDA